MGNQERTIHADTLASLGLYLKFDLYMILFYQEFGLDRFSLYSQFNNQTNSADDNIYSKITGSDVKLPVLHFVSKQKPLAYYSKYTSEENFT